MGIRETMNNNPAITTGATVAVIVVALAFIIYSSVGGGNRFTPPTKAYFTVDDGATYFSDDIKKIPPFDKDGKEAVRAHVFSCKGGSDPFIAYLERMTPDAKKKMETMMAQPEEKRDFGAIDMLQQTGYEFKKPGATNKWIKMTDSARFGDITAIKCPNGDTKNLVPVFP